MDMDHVSPLVGHQARERFLECFDVLERTPWPLYFVGPSGSGKTAMAMSLAKGYAKRHAVPAYYVQLSPEQTKTSLILGLRLVNGSLLPVKGMVAEAMSEGGIVVVDEATHATQELLLVFNSILDRVSVTSIGDEVVHAAKTFRVIFCGNDSAYAGNIRLPQSFAQRLVAFKFDYPSAEDEVKIVSRIIEDEVDSDEQLPEGVVRYVVSWMREARTADFPLSARSAAIACSMLMLAKKQESADDESIDKYFTSGPFVDSSRAAMLKKLTMGESYDEQDLNGKLVVGFMKFVTLVGVQRFRELVMSAMMVHLDVDGTEILGSERRSNLWQSLI